MSEYERLSERWKLPIPDEAAAFLAIKPSAHVEAAGQMFSVPWPPLTPDEILGAAAVADDWEILVNYVPVMGDFHDLVCLAFEPGAPPQVVILNDSRIELARFATIGAFVESISYPDEPKRSTEDIIRSKSWLDF